MGEMEDPTSSAGKEKDSKPDSEKPGVGRSDEMSHQPIENVAQTATETPHHYSTKESQRFWIGIIVQVLLTVATFMLYLEASRSGNYAREAVRAASESARAAVAANAVSDSLFRETKKSNEFNREIAKIDVRAYIYVHKVHKPTLEFGHIYSTQIDFINIGRTVARRIVFGECFGQMTKSKLRENFDSLTMAVDREKSSLFNLGPGLLFARTVEAVMWSDSATNVIALALSNDIFLGGIVKYQDCFGVEHYLRYCLRRDVASGDFVSYGEYNDEFP